MCSIFTHVQTLKDYSFSKAKVASALHKQNYSFNVTILISNVIMTHSLGDFVFPSGSLKRYRNMRH